MTLPGSYRGELQYADRIHLRNRDYDPQTGTFLTKDPLGVGAEPEGRPTSANLFAYVGNDPLNCQDPLGLCRTTDVVFRADGSVFWGPKEGYSFLECTGEELCTTTEFDEVVETSSILFPERPEGVLFPLPPPEFTRMIDDFHCRPAPPGYSPPVYEEPYNFWGWTSGAWDYVTDPKGLARHVTWGAGCVGGGTAGAVVGLYAVPTWPVGGPVTGWVLGCGAGGTAAEYGGPWPP